MMGNCLEDLSNTVGSGGGASVHSGGASVHSGGASVHSALHSGGHVCGSMGGQWGVGQQQQRRLGVRRIWSPVATVMMLATIVILTSTTRLGMAAPTYLSDCVKGIVQNTSEFVELMRGANNNDLYDEYVAVMCGVNVQVKPIKDTGYSAATYYSLNDESRVECIVVYTKAKVPVKSFIGDDASLRLDELVDTARLGPTGQLESTDRVWQVTTMVGPQHQLQPSSSSSSNRRSNAQNTNGRNGLVTTGQQPQPPSHNRGVEWYQRGLLDFDQFEQLPGNWYRRYDMPSDDHHGPKVQVMESRFDGMSLNPTNPNAPTGRRQPSSSLREKSMSGAKQQQQPPKRNNYRAGSSSIPGGISSSSKTTPPSPHAADQQRWQHGRNCPGGWKVPRTDEDCPGGWIKVTDTNIKQIIKEIDHQYGETKDGWKRYGDLGLPCMYARYGEAVFHKTPQGLVHSVLYMCLTSIELAYY